MASSTRFASRLARLGAAGLLLASLVSLSACASVQARLMNAFPFYGMAYDDNGQAAADVEVRLSEELVTMSDFNGRFVFNDILPGDYQLVAGKPGLETLRQSVKVSGQGDVLYLRLVSLNGLYVSFTEEFCGRQWQAAAGYLERALAIDPASGLLRYAQASLLYAPLRADRDWAAAEAILLALLAEGAREPALFRLLADIAEFDKLDIPAAIDYLNRYLQLEYDSAVVERLGRLRGE